MIDQYGGLKAAGQEEETIARELAAVITENVQPRTQRLLLSRRIHSTTCGTQTKVIRVQQNDFAARDGPRQSRGRPAAARARRDDGEYRRQTRINFADDVVVIEG